MPKDYETKTELVIPYMTVLSAAMVKRVEKLPKILHADVMRRCTLMYGLPVASIRQPEQKLLERKTTDARQTTTE